MDTPTIRPPASTVYKRKQEAITKIKHHYKKSSGTVNYIWSNNVKLEYTGSVTKEFKLNAEYYKKGLIKKRQFIVILNISQKRDIMDLPKRDFKVSVRKVNRPIQVSNELSSQEVAELLSSLNEREHQLMDIEC